MAGAPVSKAPSQSAAARKFDPDLLPWEKQSDETDVQYAAFRRFRDQGERSLEDVVNGWPDDAEIGRPALGSVQNWSSVWSWGWRAYQWDLHAAREEDTHLMRYRLLMNQRHRAMAQNALVKLSQWLVNMDVDRLKPMEAARWFEIAVRVQREAAGLGLMADPDGGVPQGPAQPGDLTGQSLADVLGLEGLDEDEAAAVLYRAAQVS